MRFGKLIAALTPGHSSAASQTIQFAGVRWGDPLADVKQKLEGSGYIVDAVDQGDIAFHGRIAGHDGTGWVYLARGRAVKATFSIRTDPAQVLGTYDRLRSALVRQYGQTSHGAELFEAPFAQGDGRALEALGAGKGMIATAWREEESDPNVGLVLMIGRDLAVKLSFEGPEWHAEAQRRTRAGS